MIVQTRFPTVPGLDAINHGSLHPGPGLVLFQREARMKNPCANRTCKTRMRSITPRRQAPREFRGTGFAPFTLPLCEECEYAVAPVVHALREEFAADPDAPTQSRGKLVWLVSKLRDRGIDTDGFRETKK